MKRSVHKIHKSLYYWVRKTNIITLPNYYIGRYEADLFSLTDKDLIIEYEIKISKSDYLADFQKSHTWNNVTTFKHDLIKQGSRCHRFYFVTPKGLVTKEDVPEYAGLIWHDGDAFKIVKKAPIIGRFTLGNDFFRSIAKSCSYREGNIRHKFNFRSND